ncbi:MAG: DNA glycosylase [Clostridiales bacterium]|nr:DNA glycosylase [Clostridiales bacterium]
MLIHNEYFSLRQIADSGQCFRMNRTDDMDGKESYYLIAYGRYLRLTQLDENTVMLGCSEEEYHQLWKSYFDLDYDYGRIISEIQSGDDEFLKKAVEYGKGIRILRQEAFEVLISFIISQNKNIPAIKNCIEAICACFGERRMSPDGAVYYTFPEPEVLASADKQLLRSLKTGYRDEYIIRASKAVVEGSLDLDRLCYCSYEEAVISLKQVYGIGDKVANCIALFGLHQIDGFPVDVWIKRVIDEIYGGSFPKEKYRGYAGIVQQYMFYYMRHLKGAL